MNIESKVETLYFTGVSHEGISTMLGITKNEIQKHINTIVANKSHLKGIYKQERIMKATLMEQNIFDMIGKKKNINKYIVPFVTYCA